MSSPLYNNFKELFMKESVTIHYECPECSEDLQLTYDPAKGFDSACPNCGENITNK